jgi:hypothetical protein
MNSCLTSPQKRRKGTKVVRRTKCCMRTIRDRLFSHRQFRLRMGAVLNNHKEARGSWSECDEAQYITWIELKAVRVAVHAFLPQLARMNLLLHEDNQADFYILAGPTSRSPSMMTELQKHGTCWTKTGSPYEPATPVPWPTDVRHEGARCARTCLASPECAFRCDGTCYVFPSDTWTFVCGSWPTFTVVASPRRYFACAHVFALHIRNMFE